MNEGMTAIVTGAGSGVGRATALLLAQAGYNLTLAGRAVHKLEATLQLIHQQTETLNDPLLIAVDLCQSQAAGQVIAQTRQRFGRLDALANVAGYAPNLPIEQITPQIWQRCIDTNLSAVVHLTAAAWPMLKAQHSGVIVNISSLASFDPFPGFSIYAAAKAGVNLFTHCTAQEGQPLGIRAVCLAPGAIETPMLRAIFDERSIPNHKTLSPQQVAQVIVDCITGERPFTNGQTIRLPSP